MVGPGLHVHAGKGIHHPRHRGLSGARLTTAPAFSRSIPATSRPGPSSSPNRPTRRRCSPLQSRVPMLQTPPPATRPAARRLRPEAATDATSAPDQNRRDARSGVLRPKRDREAVPGRRRRLPHQHEPHHATTRMRELVATIRAVETEHGRPIGILVDLQGPKLRVGSFAGGPATLVARRDLRARRRSGARRRQTRASAASGNHRRHRARPHACCSTTARSGSTATEVDEGPDRHARRGRRQAVGPQGREPARHRWCRSPR